jgi:hypothetical protein
MVAEYRMLRFSASLHPLALVRDQLPSNTISSSQLKDLPNGSTVRLAGIVVARQRPQTAKGYVFVLFEDEFGHVNVIVKPPIYQRNRSTIRMEPFVTVRGRLQKDGETLNVIAHEVEALRVGTLRGGASKAGGGIQMPETQEWWPDRSKLVRKAPDVAGGEPGGKGGPEPEGEAGPASEGGAGPEFQRKATSAPWEETPSPELPKTREWWGKPEEARKSPFAYLTALRQSPPGTRSWG